MRNPKDVHDEALRKISESDLDAEYASRGITIIRKSGRAWLQVKLDSGDDNPSGSFNRESCVLVDFRTGESRSVEDVLGDGDSKLGFKRLIQMAKISNGECGARNGKPPKDWPEEIKEPNQPLVDESLLQVFFTTCSEGLRAADEAYPIKKYLMVDRGIDLDLALERGIGLLSKRNLLALFQASLDARIEDFIDKCWGIDERLVFPLRNAQGRLVGFDTRGLPRTGKNPKNKCKPKLFDGFGYFGLVGSGPLNVFEGEINQLQADTANGTLVNGIAVGPAGNGKSHAEIIRKLAIDIVVIGDDDKAGREMVQAIADHGPITAVFCENGDDADEYLKAGHSWDELIARGVPMGPSWESDAKVLRELLLEKQEPEVLDEICSITLAAVFKHGKLIRANALYFLEK